MHVLWCCLTLAARPKSKSVQQNREAHKASFHKMIDDVCCYETLSLCGLCKGRGGERDYMFR